MLLAAEAYLEWPRADERVPAGFAPVAAEDAPALAAALTGVYVTGSEPGAHGIVLGGPAELKFFELGTVAAPRTVNAVYRLGQVGGRLWLATDQPGGGIAAAGDGSLRYCGETYRRIP